MVRAVTFDCWGTLIYDADPVKAAEVRVGDIATLLGVPFDQAQQIWRDAWQQHFDAWQRHEQFGSTGIASWISAQYQLSPADARALLESCEYTTMRVGTSVVNGAVETLETLRAAGIATALVCDTGLTPGTIVRQLLSEHGIFPLLDAFAFSDEVGVPKPEAAMFRTALDAIGGGPALHIGDLRRTDVAGARNFGMTTVRFNGVYDDQSDHPEAEYVIADLRELPALIGVA